MMLALGREDYARCGRVADRLHMSAERQRLARESPSAAGMMAWSYWHLGRWRDAQEVSSRGRRQPRDRGGPVHAEPRRPPDRRRATDQPDTERKPARRARHSGDVRPRAPSGSGRGAGIRLDSGRHRTVEDRAPARDRSPRAGAGALPTDSRWRMGARVAPRHGRAGDPHRSWPRDGGPPSGGAGTRADPSKWVTRVRDAQRVDRGQDGDPAQPGPPRRIGGAGATRGSASGDRVPLYRRSRGRLEGAGAARAR